MDVERQSYTRVQTSKTIKYIFIHSVVIRELSVVEYYYTVSLEFPSFLSRHGKKGMTPFQFDFIKYSLEGVAIYATMISTVGIIAREKVW